MVTQLRFYLGLLVAVLLLHPLILSTSTFAWFFSEAGPYESVSVLFWLALAVAILFRMRPLSKTSLAMSAVCALLAGREADLHKMYTAGSIFKKNYYFDAAVPVLERSIAAVVALTAIALLLYVVIKGGRWLWSRRDTGSFSYQLIIAAVALMVATKVLDRTPATLSDWFGYAAPQYLRECMLALEEGFEAVVPVLFTLAVWINSPGAFSRHLEPAHSAPKARG